MEKQELHFQAIGTHRHIQFVVETGKFQIISDYIDNLMTDFELRFSRFRDNSLVSKLNCERIMVSSDADFLAMLQIWELYRKLSHWYFSLFVWTALEKNGYGATKNIVVDHAIDEDCRIDYNDTSIQIIGNKNIDLWGIGKWYLIRCIKDYFELLWIEEYCINGGGDIAISQNKLDLFGPILLQHPLHEDEYFESISLLHGSFAWSGNMYRTRKNKEWAIVWHLIDPHTGEPANTGVLSTHVLHEDPLIADILATTFFVMPTDSIENLAMITGARYCLVMEDLSCTKSDDFF